MGTRMQQVTALSFSLIPQENSNVESFSVDERLDSSIYSSMRDPVVVPLSFSFAPPGWMVLFTLR